LGFKKREVSSPDGLNYRLSRRFFLKTALPAKKKSLGRRTTDLPAKKKSMP
jgi:hypothetical protein